MKAVHLCEMLILFLNQSTLINKPSDMALDSVNEKAKLNLKDKYETELGLDPIGKGRHCIIHVAGIVV